MNYIPINTLWSLEDVKSRYVFCVEDKQVYNLDSGNKMNVTVDKHGYGVVHLTGNKQSQQSVKYHKIVALALINNGPYELIEHLDDNKLNNDDSNLRFSNKHDNSASMYKNGITNVVPSKFEFCLEDGRIYTGSVEEVADLSGISKNTLYDYIVHPDKLHRETSRYKFKYIKEVFVGTRRAAGGCSPLSV